MNTGNKDSGSGLAKHKNNLYIATALGSLAALPLQMKNLPKKEKGSLSAMIFLLELSKKAAYSAIAGLSIAGIFDVAYNFKLNQKLNENEKKLNNPLKRAIFDAGVGVFMGFVFGLFHDNNKNKALTVIGMGLATIGLDAFMRVKSAQQFINKINTISTKSVSNE